MLVALSGDVDYATAPKIKEAMLHVLAQRPELLVIDLQAVSYLGWAGLALLVEAVHIAGPYTALRLVATSLTTLRPVQITGLGTLFSVYPTRDDALANVDPT